MTFERRRVAKGELMRDNELFWAFVSLVLFVAIIRAVLMT